MLQRSPPLLLACVRLFLCCVVCLFVWVYNQSMKTITLISQKGGSGKTTVAVHLAVCAERHGLAVAVIDTDPQGSALEWKSRRKAGTPEVVRCIPGGLTRMLDDAGRGGADLVIVDTAPHADRGMNTTASEADLILVPCRPTVFDVAALETTLGVLRLGGLLERTAVVLNSVPSRGSQAQEIRSVLSDAVMIAPVELGQRVAYANAVNDGHSVEEFDPKGKAALEIAELYAWVSKVLKMGGRHGKTGADIQTG